MLQTRCYYHMPTPQNLSLRGIDFLANKKPLETQRSHILCTKLPESFECRGSVKAQLQWFKCFTGSQACPIFPNDIEGNEKGLYVVFVCLIHSNLSLACDKKLLLFLYSLRLTSAPRQPNLRLRTPNDRGKRSIRKKEHFTN